MPVSVRSGVSRAQLLGARACVRTSVPVLHDHLRPTPPVPTHAHAQSATLHFLPSPCDLSICYPTLAHVFVPLTSLPHSSYRDLCTLCSPRSEPSVASRQRQSSLLFLTPPSPLAISRPHANRYRMLLTQGKFCHDGPEDGCEEGRGGCGKRRRAHKLPPLWSTSSQLHI